MKFDFHDLLFLVGAILLVAGVAVIYWPAALVCSGIGCIYAGVR